MRTIAIGAPLLFVGCLIQADYRSAEGTRMACRSSGVACPVDHVCGGGYCFPADSETNEAYCGDGVLNGDEGCEPGDQDPNCSPYCSSPYVVDLVAGDYHLCARMADTSVWCWGADTYDQAGSVGSDFVSSPSPVQFSPPELRTGYKSLTASGSATCGVAQDAALWCWGAADEAHQLANPVRKGLYADAAFHDEHTGCVAGSLGVQCWGGGGVTPAPDFGSSTDISKVVVGRAHACVVEGTVLKCWGERLSFQLSGSDADDGDFVRYLDVVDAAVSEDTTCAVFTNGSLDCWGGNRGRVVDPASSADEVVRRTVIPSDVVDVELGRWHACALLRSGRVTCWGGVDGTVVGSGQNLDVYDLTEVPGLRDVEQVALGADFSCALDRFGQVFCWGRDNSPALQGWTGEAGWAPLRVPFVVDP